MLMRHIALLLAVCLTALAPSAHAAVAASWTLSEIHQALTDAKNSKDELNKLLARKVYEELQKVNVEFVDNDLVYAAQPAAFRSGFREYNSDAVRKSTLDYLNLSGLDIPNLDPAIGNCNTPLPGFSLLAIEGGTSGFGGRLYGDETLFFLNAASGQIQVGVSAAGALTTDANMYLVWGGTYPVPTTRNVCTDVPYPCPTWSNPGKWCTRTECVPVPDVEWKCEEWKDGAGMTAGVEVRGSVIATLDTSFSVTDRQIVIEKNLALSGDIYSIRGAAETYDLPNILTPYVTPDIHSITGPSLSSPYSLPILTQIVGIPVGIGTAAAGALALWESPNALAYLTSKEGALAGLSLAGYEQEYVRVKYQEFLAKQNAKFEEKGYNQPIIVQLPEDVDDQLLQDVLNLLNQSGITTFLIDFVRANLHEILYYLLTDDRAALEALFTSAAACEAIKGVAVSMPVVPLYAKSALGTCEATDVYGEDRGQYFTDPSCTKEVAYRPTPELDYCRLALAGTPNAKLGNAAIWQPDSYQVNDVTPNVPTRKWTQWLGTRIPMSADPITGNSSPYMKQVRYRDVTSAGHANSCALEMRIFKKDIAAQNRPALIALHGGSWTYRGAGYTALETTISHYTERGFVVFVPFYRLVEANDGSPECNSASWNEVVSDTEAALDWVKYYGPLYGAGRGRIAVTGQSAGAHLSEWLITHRPQDVSAGMLHYAPADAYDFVANAHTGGIYEPWISSLTILSDFFGTDVSQIDLNTPPDFLVQNSFARLVQASVQPLPPVFMLHGEADPLVPSNQAVVLCNAYGGAAVNDGGGTALRAVYGCGSGGGQLHLFEEGVHGLDACITNGLCLSGSMQSANLVADSSRTGRDWLYERTALPIVLPVVSVLASKGTGGGVMDGDLATSWVARNGEYLEFDLSVSRPVGAVGVVWGGGQTTSAPTFAVETSLDRASWTQVFTGQGSGITRDIEVFDFADTEARYVRFVARSGDQTAQLRIGELRLYGPAIPGPISTSLVQAPVTGLQAVWRTMMGDDQWNQYDLGGLYEIAHVMFSVPENEKVELQFSTDGETWTTVPFSQGPGNDRLLDFRDINARALRLKAPRNGSVSGDVKFAVYGERIDTWAAGVTAPSSGGGGGSAEWALLLLGVLPWVYRRRRSSTAFAR